MIGISNTVAYNGLAGVTIEGETALHNTVTRNVIYQNGGLPIDWTGVTPPTGPLSPPTLTSYSFEDNTLRGSASEGHRVEVFANPSAEPAGTIFLGDVVADAHGVFTLSLNTQPPLPCLVATATDLDGTTSEFSSSFVPFAATNDSPTTLGQFTTLTATILMSGDISYTWAFGDGDISSGAVVTHTYPDIGFYTAMVTASNSVNVLTATTTITITGHELYLPLVLCNHTTSPRTIVVTSSPRTVVVTSLDDSGPGTLRQALLDAQPADVITFDSSTFPPTSPVTISLQSELPEITANDLTIDASNAGIVLDGSEVSGGLYAGSGLVINGANGVTIRGLQILNFPGDGVFLLGSTTNATIGGDRLTGTAPLGQGNLISRNGGNGIELFGSGTTGNRMMGNYIGTDLTGSVAQGNARNGVQVAQGASDTIIGGNTSGTGNLISGNGANGVVLVGQRNVVKGNHIGTGAGGALALGNGGVGVLISLGATGNVVGGETQEARNIISGNDFGSVPRQLR